MFGLVYVRRLMDLTAAEVADKIGVQRAAVAAWERKKKVPSKRLKALSEVFDGLSEEYFSKELTEKEKLYIQHYITMKELDRHQEEYEDNTPDEFQTQSEFFYNSKIAQEHIFEVESVMYDLVRDLTPLADFSDIDKQEGRLSFFKQIIKFEKKTQTRDALDRFLDVMEQFEQKKEPEEEFEMDLYFALYKKQKREQKDAEVFEMSEMLFEEMKKGDEYND